MTILLMGYDTFTHDDDVLETWYDSYDKLLGIQQYFDEKVSLFEQAKSKNGKALNKKTEYVKIHSTEKSGNSIVCTARRATILKNQLKDQKVVDIPFYSRYAKSQKTFSLDVSSIDYVKTTAGNMTLSSTELKKLFHDSYV